MRQIKIYARNRKQLFRITAEAFVRNWREPELNCDEFISDSLLNENLSVPKHVPIVANIEQENDTTGHITKI